MRLGSVIARAVSFCTVVGWMILAAGCGAVPVSVEASVSMEAAPPAESSGAGEAFSQEQAPMSLAEAPSGAQESEAESAADSVSVSSSASPAVGSAIVVAEAAEGSRDSTPWVLVPTADGTTVLGNSTVEIDASNLSEGYVMVAYHGGNPHVKLQLTKDGGNTYTYNLDTSGNYQSFPLVGGSGGYTLNVFELVSGNEYSQACGEYFTAELSNSLLPFLYPNAYVNFSAYSTAVAKGAELAEGAANDLQTVERIYNYVITNVGYDFDKANSTAGKSVNDFLPDVDATLSSGKGICFDYAALMTAMLRSQRIPTQLVIGYAGQIYHSWINVYITDVGWVNAIIYFDGKSWVRMDPTFASSGNSSPEIMQYIGNGSNYNALYVY